ncbi:D-aminopeptidase DppA [Haloactinopolyspora alba]|uniref:D-aminopeptidase DppA n=1 Tax=Haloactinopolyspora alba TaxID=648780 RepID=A0A2P8DVD0_9ACTN|nr:M55 family metallopeptidase [Haloactinopolyspora alba]PSL01165.1 D-aminopeptidase DppA [Haloactinopolyspora alba]
MKVLISADMEGATGVTWSADVEPGTEQWQRCRSMFTSDVNGAIAGLIDGGADEVVVNEAHSSMRNLLLEQLDERASMITGRHKDLTMVEGIQAGDVDGVVFLGYHAGAGAEGVLAHTYLPNSITGVWVDGEPASEGRLNALVAAEYGTPVLLVTGDDRACADALTYAPHARTVAVKDHVSRYAARCRPPARTFADIRAAAHASTALAVRHEPATSAGPYTVEVEVDATQLAGFAGMVPTVERVAERRIRYTAGTAYDTIRCFKAVTTLISNGTEHLYG